MTQLGRTIITLGIAIFTLSAILWITQNNGQWFAGGAAIFVGCLLSGIVLSIETKNPNNNQPNGYRPSNGGSSSYQLPQRREREESPNKLESTDPYPTMPVSGNWSPPATPPPDAESDPFYGKTTS